MVAPAFPVFAPKQKKMQRIACRMLPRAHPAVATADRKFIDADDDSGELRRLAATAERSAPAHRMRHSRMTSIDRSAPSF